jgi:hypothetical protein
MSNLASFVTHDKKRKREEITLLAKKADVMADSKKRKGVDSKPITLSTSISGDKVKGGEDDLPFTALFKNGKLPLCLKRHDVLTLCVPKRNSLPRPLPQYPFILHHDLLCPLSHSGDCTNEISHHLLHYLYSGLSTGGCQEITC